MYAIPRFVMNCLFIGISSSCMGPYVLKISRRCAACTFFVNFSITIFADRGALALRVRERESERERWDLFLLLLRDGERERVRERLRVPFSRLLERLRERERDGVLSAGGGGVRAGVGDLPREVLRSRGGEDIVYGVIVALVEMLTVWWLELCVKLQCEARAWTTDVVAFQTLAP